MSHLNSIGIGVLYPELLGTYGDGGNAVILAQRLRWRGIASELVDVRPGEPIPDSLDIYLLGGGEDGPQALAASDLHQSGALHRAVGSGASVLAVCAGLQILGDTFVGLNKAVLPGLGLVDARTTTGVGPRRVGEMVATPSAGLSLAGVALPAVSGYENHQGDTQLGVGVQPFSHVTVGVGNAPHSGVDGFSVDRMIGTYCHGPVLARNPALADLILSWAVGRELDAIDDTAADALRANRFAHAARGASTAGPRSWGAVVMRSVRGQGRRLR